MRYAVIRTYGKKRPIGIHANRDDYTSWKEYARACRFDQYEFDYDEYHLYEDGDILHSVGTEDFTVERTRYFKNYELLAWYGDYNKGGHKIWQHEDSFKVVDAKPADLKAIFKVIGAIETKVVKY